MLKRFTQHDRLKPRYNSEMCKLCHCYVFKSCTRKITHIKFGCMRTVWDNFIGQFKIKTILLTGKNVVCFMI